MSNNSALAKSLYFACTTNVAYIHVSIPRLRGYYLSLYHNLIVRLLSIIYTSTRNTTYLTNSTLIRVCAKHLLRQVI